MMTHFGVLAPGRALVAALLALPFAAVATPPTTITIDCGGTGTVVLGLNDAGQAVGWTGDLISATGFVYDGHGDTCESIAVPDAVSTLPMAINDRGQVAGFYVDASSARHAFLYERGRFTRVDFPGACETVLLGLNNRGQAVGYYETYCVDDSGPDRPFLREINGTLVDLPNPGDPDSGQANGINPRGDVVGMYNAGNDVELGYLLEKGAASPVSLSVSGFNQIVPFSINAAGEVVGVLLEVWQDFPLGPLCHGFYRDRDGVITVLGGLTLAGGELPACTAGINAGGTVSGTYFDSGGQPHGFMAPLEALLPPAP